MFCICFLAYGEEHINEFNIVAKSLLEIDKDLKIIVGTDSPKKIVENVYEIVSINEEFNYNLKRIVIEKAFKNFSTVLFLDTDIFVRSKPDFSILNDLEDGIYVSEIVDLNRLRDTKGSLEYMRDYLSELNKNYSNNLFLINEGKFILKLTNNQKEIFINHWREIDLMTRPYHKSAYGLPGAMEGLIIFIAVKKSQIEIKYPEDELNDLYNLIDHFGTTNRKMNKTII